MNWGPEEKDSVPEREKVKDKCLEAKWEGQISRELLLSLEKILHLPHFPSSSSSLYVQEKQKDYRLKKLQTVCKLCFVNIKQETKKKEELDLGDFFNYGRIWGRHSWCRCASPMFGLVNWAPLSINMLPITSPFLPSSWGRGRYPTNLMKSETWDLFIL